MGGGGMEEIGGGRKEGLRGKEGGGREGGEEGWAREKEGSEEGWLFVTASHLRRRTGQWLRSIVNSR